MTRPGSPTPLAVLWTRPETARADVARVLAMSGFAAAPGDATAVVSAVGVAPWLRAGTRAALSAAGEAAPTPRLASDTRTALHLLDARADAELGVAGCLRTLASAAGDRDPEHRDTPARAVVAGARDALDAGVRHAFLVDATLVPDGPAPDAPRLPANLLLAGHDPVALDAALAGLMGLAPDSLPLLARAEAAGLGRATPHPDALVGDVAELARRPLSPWRPAPAGLLARWTRRTARWVLGDPRRAAPADTPWHALRREGADAASWSEEA